VSTVSADNATTRLAARKTPAICSAPYYRFCYVTLVDARNIFNYMAKKQPQIVVNHEIPLKDVTGLQRATNPDR
jgi:hypothetical protein